MNKQNTMQPLGETKSLQNIVIDEVCQKISDAVIDAEATSEEKYITKQKLIVSADDMNTQETPASLLLRLLTNVVSPTVILWAAHLKKSWAKRPEATERAINYIFLFWNGGYYGRFYFT